MVLFLLEYPSCLSCWMKIDCPTANKHVSIVSLIIPDVYEIWVHAVDCRIDFNLTWWRHQMETFSALLAICAGNSPVPVNSPHKGQWRGALIFSLIYAWINDWVNNREAGDLRRQRDHYDFIVMRYVMFASKAWRALNSLPQRKHLEAHLDDFLLNSLLVLA